MSNSVLLVGKLASKIKDNTFILAVNRTFKNVDGEYEKDLIPIEVWEGIIKNVKEYCSEGDIMGVKGRLQMKDNKIVVIAEKITFLSSKKDNK